MPQNEEDVGQPGFWSGLLGAPENTIVDPNTGLTAAQRQQSIYGTLGSLGALLLAAGQKQMPAERAKYLAQIGNIPGQMQQQQQAALQQRLSNMQLTQAQQKLTGMQAIQAEMKDPAAFKTKYGFDPTGLTPDQVVDIRGRKLADTVLNPEKKELTRLQTEKLKQEMEAPERQKVGNKLYEKQEDGSWKVVASDEDKKGSLEEQGIKLMADAQRNPEIAKSPEYALHFNRLYGPQKVSGWNPQTQQMEFQWLQPPIPPGVVRPAGMAAPAGAEGESGAGGAGGIASKAPTEIKLTEGQSNAVGYARRMVQAAQTLDPLDFSAAATPGFAENFLGGKAGNYSSYLRSGDRQLYEQAQRNFISAILRKESGAAIGEQEYKNEEKKYFPQPGDKPEVIEQKRKSREEAIQGMITAAGPGAKQSGIEFKPYEPTTLQKIQTMPIESLKNLDTSGMDEKEKNALYLRLRALNRGR